MIRMLTSIVGLSMLTMASASAQTTAPAPVSPPPSSSPSTATHDATNSLKMTDAEAKGWEKKPVYSSDNKHLGDVVAITRDSSGKVLGIQADVGGFLGIGASHVVLKPEQFSLNGDRVDLKMTADQSKSLPKVQK
jgi:hypothetical protein